MKKKKRIIIEQKELDSFSSDLNYSDKSIETKPISPEQDISNITKLTKQKNLI